MKVPPPQTPETIRQWDRRAIEDFGVPGVVLMENAGAGAARLLLDLLAPPTGVFPSRVAILCGPGNNGGDGFVVARHLHNQGVQVEVSLAFDPATLGESSDARVNLEIVRRMNVPVVETGPTYDPPALLDGGAPWTLVDALLGTGLSRPLRSPILEWVQAVNRSGFPVVAIDVPTGLDAKTGRILGEAVRAAHTATFAASKVGFGGGQGPELCGQIHLVDIGMPREVWDTP